MLARGPSERGFIQMKIGTTMALTHSNSSRVTQIVDQGDQRIVSSGQNMIKKALRPLYANLIMGITAGLRLLRKLTPYNRFGDKLIGFIDFYVSHRRIPTNNLIFNDVLYKIKSTDEIIHPLRVFVTDKEFIKLFVKAVVGDQYNVPTLTVLHSMDDVRAYPFPAACCIKPTHASGHVIVRHNGEAIDFKTIERWFDL